MKKIIRIAFVALIALSMPNVAGAQSKLKNILSDVKEKTSKSSSDTSTEEATEEATSSSSSSSSSTGSKLAKGLVTSLLGKNKLNEKNLEGKWKYIEPCIVLESDNVLSKIGGEVAMDKVEKSLKGFLEGIGFKEGKVGLTLESDGSGVLDISGKDIKLNWSVSDTDLVLTLMKKDIPVNASLSAGDLQLAMSMDKLLDLLETVLSGVGNISSIGNVVAKMVDKYDGLYMGLRFEKE